MQKEKITNKKIKMGSKSSKKEPEVTTSKTAVEEKTIPLKSDSVIETIRPKVKVISEVNPFKKLRNNVLGYLFEFIDIIERSKNHRFVSKKFKKAIPSKIKTERLYVENKVMLKGRQDMNDVYLSAILPENIFRPLKLNTIIETKDQGWASHSSSSWVNLAFYKDKDAKDQTHSIVLASNRAEPRFKRVETNFDLENLKDEKIKLIIDNLFPNGKINIMAISCYPGWECHMKEASIEFIYLSVNKE